MSSAHLKYDEDTNILTVPNVKGVDYLIDGKPVDGDIILVKPTKVTAKPQKGFRFTEGAEDSWTYGTYADDVEELMSTEQAADDQ